jgi:hypothetical protein
MKKLQLFTNTLPLPLFRRLQRAVRAVGTEGMEGMGTYSTTFWFPKGSKPTNIVEECVGRFWTLVKPGPRCIGMEWWLGRLKHGESLKLHTDRDRSLRKQTGEVVHPLWSSVFYLNRFPSAPTLVLDQVLSPDGKSWVPPEAKSGRKFPAIPNQYAVFRGDLRHGVEAKPAKGKPSNELRLTLLVNFWDRRPVPPNCRDYDGTIYGALQERLTPRNAPPSRRRHTPRSGSRAT